MTTITTIGRITRDFELKKSEKTGCLFANIELAVNEGYGDNKKTMFFECTVFGPDAERLVKAKAKKGSLIQVTGRFGVSEYDYNNEKRYSLKIVVLAWSYVPSAVSQNGGNGSNGNNGNNGGAATDSTPEAQPPDSDLNEGFCNLDDEDIPF